MVVGETSAYSRPVRLPEELRNIFANGRGSDDALSLPPVPFEEYWAWTEADEDLRAEWENGKVILLPMPNFPHQRVIMFIGSLMQHFLQWRGIPGKVSIAGYKTKLDTSVREPDIVYIAPESMDRFDNRYFEGAADIMVEIVSPDRNSIKRDKETKFFEYERNKAREYWIIELETQMAQFYRLNEAGLFRLVEPENGVYKSVVLEGFEIVVDWLWEDPMPNLMTIIQSWQQVPQPHDGREGDSGE